MTKSTPAKPNQKKVAITFNDDEDDDDEDDELATNNILNSNVDGKRTSMEDVPTTTTSMKNKKKTNAILQSSSSSTEAMSATSTAAAGVAVAATLTARTPTPTNLNIASLSTTPGSSGGMVMRSGKKKKKRPQPDNHHHHPPPPPNAMKMTTTTTTNNNNDNKNDDDDDNSEDTTLRDDDTRSRKRTKLNHYHHNEESTNQRLLNNTTMEINSAAVATNTAAVATTTTTTTTSKKVPPAMTREAIAAAQVTQLTVEEEGNDDDDDNDDEVKEAECLNGNNKQPTAFIATTATTDGGGGGGGFLRLLSQKLRLPSQHTPNPTRDSHQHFQDSLTTTNHSLEGGNSERQLLASSYPSLPPPPPPPGIGFGAGRRLIFDTVSKSTTAYASSSVQPTTTAMDGWDSTNSRRTGEDGTTTTTRNKFLLQTRKQQQQQQEEEGEKMVDSTSSSSSLPYATVGVGMDGTTTTLSTTTGSIAPPIDATTIHTTQGTPFSWISNTNYLLVQEWDQNQQLIILYTKRWFLLLLAGFIGIEVFLLLLGNTTTTTTITINSTARYSDHYYGWKNRMRISSTSFIDQRNKEGTRMEEEKVGEDAEEEEVLEVLQTDPILLANTRAMIRADRQNLYDIQVMEQEMLEMQKSLQLLDEFLLEQNEGTTTSWLEGNTTTTTIIDHHNKNNTKGDNVDRMDNPPLTAFVAVEDRGSETFYRDAHILLENITSTINSKYAFLFEWENALLKAEQAMDAYDEDSTPTTATTTTTSSSSTTTTTTTTTGNTLGRKVSVSEVNDALLELSNTSMMKRIDTSARLMDPREIKSFVLPMEGCKGKDYIPFHDKNKAGLDVTSRGMDINSLDPKGSSPVRYEDAQSIYQQLIQEVDLMSQTLLSEESNSIGQNETSATTKTSLVRTWAQEMVDEEIRKSGIHGDLPPLEELHIIEPMIRNESRRSKSSTSSIPGYSFHDAIRDIDHRLEIEDADRTGLFDYASAVQGARVLRRGPFATSYSYYETLPLLNRLLAYVKLRFYGHPPEVALYPTFPMHARGQCWSFINEAASVRSRRSEIGGRDSIVSNDMVGEYATLTISLISAVRVTEIVVEHPPPITKESSASSSLFASSAIQEFRVLGFEDGGAYGEPWELGRYTFDVYGSSLQTFVIPTTLFGQIIPKLRAISIAIDSNWGAEYGCLYRVRVHGD